MTGGPIRHIVFDMDGVLCRYDFPRRLEVMAKHSGVTAAAIEDAIFKSGFDDRADRGRFTAERFLRGMAERRSVAARLAVWGAAARTKPPHPAPARGPPIPPQPCGRRPKGQVSWPG